MTTLLNTNTNESTARAVEQRGDPQHAGFSILRRWEKLNAVTARSLATNLNDCTFYTNPKVDDQTYTGTFIQSSLAPKANQYDSIDLEQTLTKVKANTDSSDADIISQEGDPAVSGYELSRAWHYINPYALDTLFPVVNAVESVDDPQGNGEVQTGKFIISRVRSAEQTDRTYDIIQDMVKVKTISSDTSLTDPLIDRAKDIIHPFGEGTGVGRDIVYRYLNLDPSSDTKCMALADTSLVSKMSQNDSFIHVARKTTTETNRTMTFWVLAQRKQRIAWSDTVFKNPDHIEDQSPSRDNTIKRKFWYGIDNDCYAGTRARLTNDTYPGNIDTGFSLLGFTVRDNDDGSDDWTQTIIRQFNDTRTDSKIVNTHGIEHNGIKMIHHRFDNYGTEPTTPALTPGYKYESEKVWMDERGLISKRVLTSKPTPSNNWSDINGADSYSMTNVRNGQHTDLNGIAVQTRYSYDQVALNDVDSMMRTLDVETDARYIVSGLDYRDIGNGAARVDRDRKRINYNGSWYVTELGSPNNGAQQSIRREWPIVLDTKAIALVAANGTANDTFAYNGTDYLPIRSHRTKHYDGTSTVWQLGAVSSTLVNTGSGGQWTGDNTDSEMAYGYITEWGTGQAIIKYQKLFSDWNEAITFVDDGDDFRVQQGFTKLGSVSNAGPGSWLGIKVIKKV